MLVQLSYSYQNLVLYPYFYSSAQILLWISEVCTGFQPIPNSDSSLLGRLLPRRQGPYDFIYDNVGTFAAKGWLDNLNIISL